MRKQYYFRQSDRGLLAWDVDRLVELSRNLSRKQIRIDAIRELDEPWSDDDGRTWRGIVEHIRLIHDANLSFPIILSADGSVMDGRHRVVKAVLEDREFIEAVQFEEDPLPDHVGVNPDELHY